MAEKLDISINTTLAEDTNFDGKLNFEKSVKICGKFKGEISTNGILIISETAYVSANINAKIVIISGEVKGNIKASEKVEILPSGRVYGDITTAKLKISDGVIFEGSCHMLKEE